jgi:hypothetical protein
MQSGKQYDRYDRLNILEPLLRHNHTSEEILDRLRVAGVVSKFYSRQCLLVDVWYLEKRTWKNSIRTIEDQKTYLEHLFLQIVVQSLFDLQCGRPCDIGIWRKDTPPDDRSCRKSEHICYRDAQQFLETVNEEEEVIIGLSSGTISSLVRAIKKDPIFRIESSLR